MNKEGSTKIINFRPPRAGVLMLVVAIDYVLSSTQSIFSTLIAIVLRDNDAAFRYHR